MKWREDAGVERMEGGAALERGERGGGVTHACSPTGSPSRIVRLDPCMGETVAKED